MKSVREIKGLKGKRVLLRLGMNVPVTAGEVVDAYRLERSVETVQYLIEQEAKVIIIGHIWGDEEVSLQVVSDWFKGHFEHTFITKWHDGAAKDQIKAMQPGEVVMFENLRLHPGEKANDPEFVAMLAEYGDVYVNNAFAVAHRDHASVTGLPGVMPGYAGLLLEEEVVQLSDMFEEEGKVVCIVGGAKFESKVPLSLSLLEKSDVVYVAGAIMNQFFKEFGMDTGKSLVDKEQSYGLADHKDNKALLLPTDAVMVAEHEAVKKRIVDIEENEVMLDIGDESLKNLLVQLTDAKTVIWNGPLGDYERGFRETTETLAYALAEIPAKTIIGGGDTLAVVDTLGITEKYNFVSTGGGAMLDFLKDGTLVGIEALK